MGNRPRCLMECGRDDGALQVPVASSDLRSGMRSGVGICVNLLPASNPGDFSSQRATKIDHRWVQFPLGEGCPQFQLVALAVALVAMVATDRHVYREVPAAIGRGFVQGTSSVPLVARSLGWLEAEQGQNLLHRDLTAKPFEVDSGHGFPRGAQGLRGETATVRTVPFPLSL